MYNKKTTVYKAPFFFTASTGRRSRGCIPRALVTETRKSGNEKVARGRSGFIENRTVDGTDESFLARLLPSPLPLPRFRVFRESFLGAGPLIDRKREVTFHLLSLPPPRRVTRILFKSRINRERKLA